MAGEDIFIPNFYEYLVQQGIDQSSLSETDYENLREEYRRHRNKLYKKRQRISSKEILIHLTSDEYNFLLNKAKEHELQIGKYLKLSSIGYSKNLFIIPDKNTFKELLISVQNIEQKMQSLADAKTSSIFGNNGKYNQLVEQVRILESSFKKSMNEPINVYSWIKEKLNENDEFKKEIIKLILNEP